MNRCLLLGKRSRNTARMILDISIVRVLQEADDDASRPCLTWRIFVGVY